jgi:hypothetical protein
VTAMPRGSDLLSALAESNCLIESYTSGPIDMQAGETVHVTRTDSGV